MTNARSARDWVANALGATAVADHFVAVSTRLDKVAEFGIERDRCSAFGIGSAVGTRSGQASASCWRSQLAPTFMETCSAEARTSTITSAKRQIENNFPCCWDCFRSGTAISSTIPRRPAIPVRPTSVRFPAYLQQRQMESNGKSVDRRGGG